MAPDHPNHSHPNLMDDGFIDVPTSDGLPAYKIFNRPIITSASDSRSYRIIRLENNLNAILVHDPKTDKAAAAMDVNVGHLSDPENLQGLAHFCEHLLFLGNEKYPSENDYSEYLSKHSGHSNAFTGMDDTVYYFDVHPSALDGALDRFSQFFISPLFSESCTDREIRAVDSENSKNLQTDVWRMFQLDKATSSRSHSYWRFGTGNLKTLSETPKSLGLEIREELLKFYAKHYSSNVMNLAILGKESLDDLTKLVVQKFSLVPNRNIIPDRFDGSPYTEKELGKLIFAKMVKDTNLLELTFPVPDQGAFYNTQPTGFISHHVGHEGPGSILSYLKKKGWVNTLSAGALGGATGFEMWKITLDLTPDGLANYQEVVQVVFTYLNMLKSTPPQEWMFKEQALLADIRFRFKSPSPPSTYVTSLASWMRRPCPKDQVLSSVYLINTFDSQLIKDHLEMLRPENCRILVGTQSPVPGVNYDSKEKWYGTEYTIRDLPKEFLKPTTPIDGLSLPPPNSFISTKFQVDKMDNILYPTRRPKCLNDDQFGRTWHKKDDRWWLPRASVVLMMRNPITNSDCLNSLKTYFIAKLLKDSSNEQLYEAELAGLGYSIGTSWDALVFNVDGYNQKLYLLMDTILRQLRNLKVDPERFQVLKDEAERNWKNFVLEGPYSHASYWMGSILTEVHYSYEEKLGLLKDLKAEDIEAFIPQVLSRGFVETLVHGNLTAHEAMEFSTLPQKIFCFHPVPSDELKPFLPRLIPKGSNLVYERPLANSSNINSAVDYFIGVGDIADRDIRTKLSLLNQIMHEPCFNRLRTKEQLGYIVRSYTRMSPGLCGLSVAIQSERDPAYVESRIENFLSCFLSEKLETIRDDEFEEMKNSLINKAVEDFKNMSDETAHYWTHIKAGYYAFEQRFADAQLIRQITKESMLDFYREYIHPQSTHRAKCSTQIKSQRVPVPNDILLKVSSMINSPSQSSSTQAEKKDGTDRFVLGPDDLQFLHSKPDRAQLIERLQSKKHPGSSVAGQRSEKIDSIINLINNEYQILSNQVHQTLSQQARLHQLPETFRDLSELRARLQIGTGAVPDPDWKLDPILNCPPPKL